MSQREIATILSPQKKVFKLLQILLLKLKYIAM